MKYEVDGWNNFMRVFRLPSEFSHDFCFGGGHPTNFQMVDWFYPIPDMGTPAISREEWAEKVGEHEVRIVDGDELANDILIPFLQQKTYVKAGQKFIAICDFGFSFMFEASKQENG